MLWGLGMGGIRVKAGRGVQAGGVGVRVKARSGDGGAG